MARTNESDPIIQPTTDAVSTKQHFNLDGGEVPARLTCTNLINSESYALFSVDGPSDTYTAVYRDGVAVTAKATDPVLLIDAPGNYALTKSATVSASGAYLTKGN